MTTKNVQVSQNNQGEKVFTLCGTNNCCPTVTVDKEGNHVLKDDFGGTVKLSKEQFSFLKEIN
jgi:hypothetical protein